MGRHNDNRSEHTEIKLAQKMSDSDHSENKANHTRNETDVSDSCTFHSDEASGGSTHNSGNYQSLLLALPDEDPHFVDPDEKYECRICAMNKSSHRLLRNPVQTKCGHRMCETCVDVYLGAELSKKCPFNEGDCEQVTRDTVFHDPGCRREIKHLLVYCCYQSNGCQERIKLSMLEKHKTECEFQNVQCTYLSRGCPLSVQLKDLGTHIMDCKYRPVICELCGTEYSFTNKREHDTETCPEAIVNCPYLCGILNLKRRKLEDHKNICVRKPETCKFQSLGCTFTGSKTEVEKHEQDVDIHFQMFLGCFTSFKMEAQDQQKEMEECKQLSEEQVRVTERIENSLRNVHRDLKLKMVGQMERTIVAEQKVDELKETMASFSQQSENLLQSIEHLKTLIPQVANHDRQLSSFTIQMAAMDLRFQMIETTSYDGTLLWKICDFNKRKRDAVDRRTVSLYSQPFYTSRFGYKLCARLYPNGDGIGHGTHMSLYFVVMKGEHDALLPWPFQCKVGLMLLDQSPRKHHLKDEFLPDPESASFKRPVNAEMNIASGCPLFVSHTVLNNQTSNYIKDDVLFIKILVDTTNLQPI